MLTESQYYVYTRWTLVGPAYKPLTTLCYHDAIHSSSEHHANGKVSCVLNTGEGGIQSEAKKEPMANVGTKPT